MELSEKLIQMFKEAHKPYGGLPEYTDEQIREIANGVARYALQMYKIRQKQVKRVDAPKTS